MTSMPSYPGPPPSSWRGYFPGQPPPGVRVPPHFPHPPPMPPGYSYGERAWMNGSWVPAPGQYPNYNWGQRPPRKPPSAEYWRQELKENPLELSGMIPAEELARREKEAEEAARPVVPDSTEESTESSSMVWVPALSDTMDPSRGRDRRGLRRSRSSSQPLSSHRRERDRALSPTHQGASQAPQHSSTYPIMGPLDPYDDEDDGIFDDPRKHTRPRAYRTGNQNKQSAAAAAEDRDRRGPERNIRFSSEPPVDVGRVAEPESYLSGVAENDPLTRSQSQSQSQSQQPPGLVQPDALHHSQHHPYHHRHHPFHAHNHTRAASVDPYVSQGLLRSQTLPVDRIYSSSNLYSQADPPPSSSMYASQVPYDLRAAQMNLTPTRMGPQRQGGGRRWSQDESNSAQKESRNAERIRDWITTSNREILKAAQERAKRENERPQMRHTVDSYPSRTPDREHVNGGTPTRDGAHMRSAQKENVMRHSSLPALQSSSAHMTNITEEPEDLAGQFAKVSLGDGRDDRSPLQKKPSNQSRALGRTDTLPAEYEGERFVSPSRPEYGMGGLSSSQMSKTSPSQYAQYVTPPITPTRQPQLYRQSDKGSSSTLNLPLSAQPSRSSLHQSASPAISPYRQQDHFSTPPTRVVHVSSGSNTNTFQTPAHLQYLYRPESSPTSRPQQPYGASPKGLGQSPAHAPVRVHYSDPFDYHPEDRSRSGSSSRRNSRSPSPLPPHMSTSMPNARSNNFSNSAHNTPTRVPHGPVGPNPSSSRNSRNVRKGLWNRRGDHLTHDGFVVYCPPGRNFPSDLTDYPDDAFMDEKGTIVRDRPERHPEHPDSIPAAGKSAVKPYDMFVEYVLVDR